MSFSILRFEPILLHYVFIRIKENINIKKNTLVDIGQGASTGHYSQKHWHHFRHFANTAGSKENARLKLRQLESLHTDPRSFTLFAV